MAKRFPETISPSSPYDLVQNYLQHNSLRYNDMLYKIDQKARLPHLPELISLDHKKLDFDKLPEGSHPVDGQYFHLSGYMFDHKDSKDPQRLIEELPDGSRRHHIYFSRGVSKDIVRDLHTGEPLKDPRYFNIETNEPRLENIEVWGVGHLVADNENGPWFEVEPTVIHDVSGEPQMCAPSVYYTGDEFHMIIQGACFQDNHPIYHFTSSNGTDFYPQRKLLEPIPGSSEAGVYDVDIINDDGKFFVVYSAMEPMGPDRKAINEIHLAYLPSLTGEGEAERLVELDDNLWVRVVKIDEQKYGYFLVDDTDNTSRIVRREDGSCIRLMPDNDASVSSLLYADGVWVSADGDGGEEWEDIGYESSPQPGTPIIRYADIPGHNPHPPVRQADETESQRIEREKLEANFEWGLEGMQLVKLPNGLYAMLGVCFLSDEPVGSRQRAFMAVSDKITGPFTPLGLLVNPNEDEGWGDGENGHASAEIIDDKLHILYQARNPYRDDDPLEVRYSVRWQLGEASCSLTDLCTLAEHTLAQPA